MCIHVCVQCMNCITYKESHKKLTNKICDSIHTQAWINNNTFFNFSSGRQIFSSKFVCGAHISLNPQETKTLYFKHKGSIFTHVSQLNIYEEY